MMAEGPVLVMLSMRFLFGFLMSGKWKGIFFLCNFLYVTYMKTLIVKVHRQNTGQRSH